MNKINYYLGVLILLPGSKKYSGKFTAEEVEIIERFMKKYNVNPNQLVKRSVFLAIGYTEYVNLASTDPKFRKIFETVIDESQKIMSNPRILKRIEKKMAAEKISQEALDRLESVGSDIDKDVKTLRKKKKPGPKKTKKKRGSSDLVVKDALLLRTKISKTRPKFQRQESWRYDRIKINWRKPKGFDSKMRIQKKGWPAIVKIGYRGPKSARGLHPSGFYDKLVYNIDELNILNPKTDAIRISSKIGKRYKLTIVNKAEKLGFHILNPHINNKRKR